MPTTTFPDIEEELKAWLDTQLTGVRVCTELPPDLDAVLPVVRIQRISGADGADRRLDRPIVDIDAFAATRKAASDLSVQIRDLVRNTLRGAVTTTVVFGAANTIAGPRWLPDDNTNLRRFQASYEIPFHPVPS